MLLYFVCFYIIVIQCAEPGLSIYPAQRETIEKQNIKISELEEKDRKIIELEQKFQSLSQYVNPAISSIISQLEDLS